MRIRFRASDLGLVANKNIIRAKSKQASCAEMVLGSFVFSLVRVTQQLVFWNQKIQANVDYYHVWRRVECTSLGPGLKHLSLRADSIRVAWPRRDMPRRFTFFFFFQQSIRAQHVELLLCVYSRMIRSHKRRALGALLSLFSRSEPASTES